MSCERFREAITDHAAGKAVSGAAAEHLASCDSCRSRLDQHRRILAEVDQELATMLSVGAPPEFGARVMSHAAVANSRSIAWRPAVAWVGLAAAAAIVIASLLQEPAPAATPAPPESAAVAPSPATTPVPVETHAVARTDRQPAIRGSRPRPSSQIAAARHMQEPPVIVGPEQARAIARLTELLIDGRLTPKMLPPSQPHETAELTVAPLEIPEIIVPDVEDVGRAPGVARELE